MPALARKSKPRLLPAHALGHSVPVEVSARHVHLTQAHLEHLFGAGHELRQRESISQPGQFAAHETVVVVGPQGELTARIVGPVRAESQVELTATECRLLGLPVVLRVSGELAGTPGCRLRGPQGEVTLHEGVVVPQRHLHIAPALASAWGLKHGDTISVRTQGSRPVTFHDVYVRSREGVDELSFMLDTDEANAAGLVGGETGVVVDVMP